MRWQIVIEGTNYDQIADLWEKLQNKYGLYDNCVLQEADDEDSIIESEDRCEETGIECKRPSKNSKK